MLVIGASGGVGTFAVQLCAAFGAQVVGVCGPAGADPVRALEATDVIDDTREEITDRPGRYDVIVDCAGNRPLSLLRRVLAPRGTLAIVGVEGAGRWFGLGPAAARRAHVAGRPPAARDLDRRHAPNGSAGAGRVSSARSMSSRSSR